MREFPLAQQQTVDIVSQLAITSVNIGITVGLSLGIEEDSAINKVFSG